MQTYLSYTGAHEALGAGEAQHWFLELERVLSQSGMTIELQRRAGGASAAIRDNPTNIEYVRTSEGVVHITRLSEDNIKAMRLERDALHALQFSWPKDEVKS